MAHGKLKITKHKLNQIETYRDKEFANPEAPKYALLNLDKTLQGTEYMAILGFDALVTPNVTVMVSTQYDGKITRTTVDKYDSTTNEPVKPTKVFQVSVNHRFVGLNEDQMMLQMFNILVNDLLANGSQGEVIGKDHFVSLVSGALFFNSNIFNKGKFKTARVMKLTADGEGIEKEHDELWIAEYYTKLLKGDN